MPRDLRFAWEEMPQQLLDEQAQKVRGKPSRVAHRLGPGVQSGQRLHRQPAGPVPAPRGALVRDPQPAAQRHAGRVASPSAATALPAAAQYRHPGGRPGSGIVGASHPPASLPDVRGHYAASGGSRRRGWHASTDARGSWKAWRCREEEDEFALRYYNSMTTWIDLDRLLELFGLRRDQLADEPAVTAAIRTLSLRMPTLRNDQGRQETMGARTGGCVPSVAVRKTMGRHDRAGGGRLPVRGRASSAWPAAQGSVAIGRMVARWVGSLRRGLVRVGDSIKPRPVVGPLIGLGVGWAERGIRGKQKSSPRDETRGLRFLVGKREDRPRPVVAAFHYSSSSSSSLVFSMISFWTLPGTTS